VQVPTGGDEGDLLVRDPVSLIESGGFGEIPKPTVKVWMGEGMYKLFKKDGFERLFVMQFSPLPNVVRDFLIMESFKIKSLYDPLFTT
jgi:hypothetical protein